MTSPHHHQGTITSGDAFGRPYHAQCSCGTAGDFADKDAARAYLQAHFGKLSGISTSELVETHPLVDTPIEKQITSSEPPPPPPSKKVT